MQKLFILVFLLTGVVMACNNSRDGAQAVSSVDSAAKAAPDTIRPSMDTTAKKHI